LTPFNSGGHHASGVGEGPGLAVRRHRTRERRGSDWWAPATFPGGVGSKRFKPFQNFKRFKNVQNFPNFDRSKFDLPELQKFEIKYGFEDLEKMNNLLHRNFFRFRRNLELKFREFSRFEFNIM
jgi:hypothetical protein